MIRKRLASLIAVVAVVGGMLTVVAMSASANLAGSSFEGGDGNMVVNTAGNTDWANAPNLHVGQDLPSGTGDNSFGQGTKEDNSNVTVVSGSIPNSKADLGQFAVSSLTGSNGDVFLNLAWTRVNQSGTTNFDFELNQKAQPDLTTPGPKTLNRTVGDVLLLYDFQGGAQKPTLSKAIWQGTQWGPETPIAAAAFEAAVNTAPIPNLFGTPSPLPAAQFGEASVDLNLAGIINPNQCENLASAFVKSRSSNAFTAEIKDFIAPIPTGINTCSTLIVKKVTVPSPDPTNTAFPFTTNAGAPFSLHNGEQTTVSSSLNPGTYNVAEQTPAGWILTGATCDNGDTPDAIHIGASQTVTCTFTNTGQGRIIVKKLTDPSGSAQTFNFTSSYGAPFSLADGQSNDSGLLNAGTYSVAEGAEPAGWIPLNSSCDDGSPISAIVLNPGETVTCTFTNQAQGRIIVHKAIQGPADTTTEFGFTSNYGAPFSLNSTETNDSGFLNTGTYNVAETPQANWKLVGATCDNGDTPDAIHLAPGATVNCTFTNQLQVGSITIVKTHVHKADGPGDHPEAGVTFVVTGPSGMFNVTTGADGTACVDSLFFGDYTVHEQVPAGEVPDVNDQTVTVNAVSACGDGNGSLVGFHNVPLTDIHVQAHSQVPGGTLATITCDTGASGGPAGDASADSLNLKPGTYSCTVVVDP